MGVNQEGPSAGPDAEGGMRLSRWLRLVAVLEMVGGAVGAVGSLYWLGHALTHTVVPFGFLASSILFTGLFALGFVAGLYLWKGERRGVVLSRWVQGLQIIQLGIGTFALALRSGLVIALAAGSFGFNAELFSVGSGWALGPYHASVAANLLYLGAGASEAADPEGAFVIGLNIVAIVILVYLFRQRSIPTGPTETERALRQWFRRR